MYNDTVTVDEQEDETTVTDFPDDGFVSKEDLVDAVLSRADGVEAGYAESMEIAVDTTIRYVLEWLRATGYSAKADILETTFEGAS